jgi:hypothetical protein
MKKEGELYDACKGRCQPVLGFMLCGLWRMRMRQS